MYGGPLLNTQLFNNATLNSTFFSGNTSTVTAVGEARTSQYSLQHAVYVDLTANSSLSGGALWLEEYSPDLNQWIKCEQRISLISASGTAPNVISTNNAAATMIVGSTAQNCSGITSITNNLSAIFTADSHGTPVRMNGSVSSGSITLNAWYIGSRAWK